jgi:CRISPR/Cas system-associated exonuclease Cas4 (RecB family)
VNFIHEKLPGLDFELEAITTETGRKYLVPNGKKYNSITTILKPYNQHIIENWKESVGEEEAKRVSGIASRRGEALHLACEKYLLNELNDFKIRTMMPNIKELFLQLRPHLDKSVGKIYSIEQPLYSDELQVAGRVDLIAEWDGKISIVDYKTSGKFKDESDIANYFMQCTAYAIMFEERTGVPINQIVIAMAVVNENTPLLFVREKKDYIEQLKYFVRLNIESLSKQL